MVNFAFGFEFPRPMGPLVELIDPIVPQTYSILNDKLQTFLDHRRKVVYVAFGQLIVPKPSEIKLILTALLENMETKHIDGIIWSTLGIQEHFPDIINTRTNTTYDINSFFTNPADNSNIAFVNWAPQVAILHHPSTCLFLTHGGAGTLYESMHAAVPIAVFPYFSDQPATAISAEEHGTGRWFKRTLSQDQATDLIKEIIDDTAGKYRHNIGRFKALVQIRNAHCKQCGADLVEVIFTHVNGKLEHRRDICRDFCSSKHTTWIYIRLYWFP
ncbi:UDP-Glycosyltransferase/glycogen phosphorylase [Rhizopus microsporus ATCC 52813]|uniref:UDP-Glycosyltransferase/glycogen phosphorylase n=1 Tax=Rhizopus microsporus ATCC 52813 TaxID=1340429 RepID=A0A2G4SN96_RHIZD|nr:UDP-Glycosyltransferase/glycogen phosphorylase [Rhizopus microsporus ATCC 52813]PHZ09856.1 UDP-Glycosyltransferase/glycogen phosphorylase [Rhizopus microsporus ATCC 52813]